MPIRNPEVTSAQFRAFLAALGIVNPGAAQFLLHDTIIPTFDIARFLVGLPTPTIAVAGTGAGVETGELYVCSANLVTGVNVAAWLLMDWNFTGAATAGVTGIDLLGFTVVSSLAYRVRAGLVRANINLSTQRIQSQRTATQADVSLTFRFDTFQGADQWAGPPFPTIDMGANAQAATTTFTWPRNAGDLPLTLLPPFANGDGFLISCQPTPAAVQTVFWTALLRVRGFPT